jgi:hypothetical protein
MYKLRDWISFDNIDLQALCENPHPEAVNNVELYLLEARWQTFSENPFAGHILSRPSLRQALDLYGIAKNPCDEAVEIFKTLVAEGSPEVFWRGFSANTNPKAVEFLTRYYSNNINWDAFSANECDQAVDYLLQNPGNIEWNYFAKNSNPRAVAYFLQNFHQSNIDYLDFLSQNTHPDAVAYLVCHPERINWLLFSQNPTAIDYIKVHLEEVDWCGLSKNPHPEALDILEKNQDQIDWIALSTNPGIFEYDYEAMRHNCGLYEREFVDLMMNPRNYEKFEGWGFI